MYKSEGLEKIMEDVPSLFCEDGNSSDYQFAKPNSTESTYTKSSKTVGSNQTVVAGHSRVDISGTCPANYETSLAKRNMDDTCPIENNSSTFFTRIRNKLPSISSLNPFGSHERRVSTVNDSDYQSAKSNFQASTEVGNKAIRRNHSTSAKLNCDACPAKSFNNISVSSFKPSMTVGS